MDDEELYDEFETVTMTDEETGEDIEFAIIDHLEDCGQMYLLVIESELMDDEEAEACLMKQIGDEEDSLTYELVEDDEEFDKIAALFQEKGGEYDVEIDE